MHAGIESWEDYYKNQPSVAKGGRGKEKDDYRRWEKRGREREIERWKDRGNACESGKAKGRKEGRGNHKNKSQRQSRRGTTSRKTLMEQNGTTDTSIAIIKRFNGGRTFLQVVTRRMHLESHTTLFFSRQIAAFRSNKGELRISKALL